MNKGKYKTIDERCGMFWSIGRSPLKGGMDLKKKSADYCTGCSRHCPANAPRCKYGKKLFANRDSQERKEALLPARERFMPEHDEQAAPAALRSYRPRHKHPRKWERHISPGGTAWQLLFVSRSIKKALHHRELSEDQIFSTLTPAEQQTLCAYLNRIYCRIG